MATRSTIHKYDGKTLTSIYCHWDGYPSNNGKILLEHYKEENKIDELLSLGDLSILGEKVSTTKPHTFDNPQNDVCVFYGRDRGETGTVPKKNVMTHFPKSCELPVCEEFQYLYDSTKHKWYVMFGATDNWNELTEEMCKDD